MNGQIREIYITTKQGMPMQALSAVKAVAGMGLEGDRYAAAEGFYSGNATTPGAREITLIELESLAAAARAAGVELHGRETRRNLVTEDIRLKELLGKRFTIGEVVCEGVRDCPPCKHLDQLTGKFLMPHLVHTGGLRARIVEGGTISVGDSIEVVGDAAGPTHRAATDG
jgi:MOSC domain-containing protein YiiM